MREAETVEQAVPLGDQLMSGLRVICEHLGEPPSPASLPEVARRLATAIESAGINDEPDLALRLATATEALETTTKELSTSVASWGTSPPVEADRIRAAECCEQLAEDLDSLVVACSGSVAAGDLSGVTDWAQKLGQHLVVYAAALRKPRAPEEVMAEYLNQDLRDLQGAWSSLVRSCEGAGREFQLTSPPAPALARITGGATIAPRAETLVNEMFRSVEQVVAWLAYDVEGTPYEAQMLEAKGDLVTAAYDVVDRLFNDQRDWLTALLTSAKGKDWKDCTPEHVTQAMTIVQRMCESVRRCLVGAAAVTAHLQELDRAASYQPIINYLSGSEQDVLAALRGLLPVQ